MKTPNVGNCKKKCSDSDASKLIIIHSKGKYFEENGFQILKETGFTSYPFVGEKVVPSAIAARGKKLSTVLEPNVELLRGVDLDDAKGGLVSSLHGYSNFRYVYSYIVFLLT